MPYGRTDFEEKPTDKYDPTWRDKQGRGARNPPDDPDERSQLVYDRPDQVPAARRASKPIEWDAQTITGETVRIVDVRYNDAGFRKLKSKDGRVWVQLPSGKLALRDDVLAHAPGNLLRDKTANYAPPDVYDPPEPQPDPEQVLVKVECDGETVEIVGFEWDGQTRLLRDRAGVLYVDLPSRTGVARASAVKAAHPGLPIATAASRYVP